MLSIRQALELMLPHFQPRGTERVPLLEAGGRVLGQDVEVSVALPEFDHSAMDGYAFRAGDVQAEQRLSISGESRAGGHPQPLAAGTVQRILTGAPMPAGADTVVIQENTRRSGAELVIHSLPPKAANVRTRGSELQPGQLLLAAGARLGPSEIGLLASQSLAEVEVYRRPRVAILPTGDELRALTDPPRPYSIVDSNTYAVATALTEAGCVAVPLASARDDLGELGRRIAEGLALDLLLTIGGVSVGDHDYVEEALRAAGVEVGFHKVAIKPGKPLLFGTRGTTPVVGLPGNPVSALITFEVFVRPCLLRMQGHPAVFPEPIEVMLAEPYRHAAGRTELLRAELERVSGGWQARLRRQQGSAALSSLAGPTALVIAPAQRTEFAQGERMAALLLAPARRVDSPFED
ncbi:MAG: gephyrin-like molybdotransferase Glp [Polyangiales bacterium]